MLANLFELEETLRSQSKLITNIPDRLPDTLEKQLSSSNVQFFYGSAKTTNKDGQFTFIALQEFYLAALAMPVVHTIKRYQQFLKEQLPNVDLDKHLAPLRDKDIKYLDSPPDEYIDVYYAVNNKELTTEDQNYLKQFILNYDLWHGKKSAGRDDAYVSAVHGTIGTVQSSSSIYTVIQKYLADPIAEKIAKDMVEKYLSSRTEDVTLKQIGEYNLILAGAPGTGKSFALDKKIKELVPDKATRETHTFRQTLYPDYSYNDFVGQIMPVNDDGIVTYKFVPSVFTLALKKALQVEKDEENVFLILEELSRANAAAVFGDIFQLLDRNENGESEYRISNYLIASAVYGPERKDEKIYLPSNLYIWGTINTSDQNVFTIDTAFKRRFTWQYISTKPSSADNNPIITLPRINQTDWNTLYQAINKVILNVLKLSEDKQIGQFFIKFSAGNDEAATMQQLQNKLLQYLWDDVNHSSLDGLTIFDAKYSDFASLFDDFPVKPVFAEEIYAELESTTQQHGD